MKKYSITFLILWGLATLSAQPEPEQYGAGLNFDDEAYLREKRQSPDDGIKDVLPLTVDLTPYCPEVRNQGKSFSCVGWAVGYGAMSIQRAIYNDCTDVSVITNHAHSALFLYNQIHAGNCQKGAKITDALRVLKERGDCLARQFDVDLEDCVKLPNEEHFQVAHKFTIHDYFTLFDLDAADDVKVLRVKRVLAMRKPVIIGMQVLQNFFTLREALFWHPEIGNQTSSGGHAMVVVGYDDKKGKNGAFRIMNSWGKNWGDGGFIWVAYDDFAKYCKYAFTIYFFAPQQPTIQNMENGTNDPAPIAQSAIKLAGSMEFRCLVGWTDSNMPLFKSADVVWNRNHYVLDREDWPVGQQFQLLVSTHQEEQYLYVFSIDAKKNVNFHWPHPGTKESALLLAKSNEVTIPGRNSALLIEYPGSDYLIMVCSKWEIETIEELAQRIGKQEGDVTDNLLHILKNYAVDAQNITRAPNGIAFESTSFGQKYIVPLVLEVKSK